MNEPTKTEVPRELSMYVPRAVRLSRAGWALASLAAVLSAAAAVVPSLLWSDRERKAEFHRRIEREGIPVEAEVTRTGKTREDHPRPFADYRFDGGTGRVVLREGARPPATGERIPVRYLPGAPERSWAVGHEPSGAPLPVLPVLAASFLIGPALILVAVRRQWRLLAEGRAALARIVSVKKTKSGHGHNSYRAEYEFALLSGAVRRVWADAAKQSAEGSLVPILYDPENPKRLSRYPLSLVRVARDQ